MINFIKESSRFQEWSENRGRYDELKNAYNSIIEKIKKKKFSNAKLPDNMASCAHNIDSLCNLGAQVNVERGKLAALLNDLAIKVEERDAAIKKERNTMYAIIIGVLLIVGTIAYFLM